MRKSGIRWTIEAAKVSEGMLLPPPSPSGFEWADVCALRGGGGGTGIVVACFRSRLTRHCTLTEQGVVFRPRPRIPAAASRAASVDIRGPEPCCPPREACGHSAPRSQGRCFHAVLIKSGRHWACPPPVPWTAGRVTDHCRPHLHKPATIAYLMSFHSLGLGLTS